MIWTLQRKYATYNLQYSNRFFFPNLALMFLGGGCNPYRPSLNSLIYEINGYL